MRVKLTAFILLLAVLAGVSAALAEPGREDTSGGSEPSAPELDTFERRVGRYIRKEIEAVRVLEGHIVLDERLLAGEDLVRFYESRQYRPAWASVQGPRLESFRLAMALRDVRREGLEPSDYHFERLMELFAEVASLRRNMKPQDEEQLAMLDILLSDAFLSYARHVRYGRVPDWSRERFWGTHRPVEDLAALLRATLENGSFDDVLWELPPQHMGYVRLRSVLARYRRIEAAGGWLKVEPGPSMRMGDMGERVKALRERLATSGELSGDTDTGAHVFGPSLEKAVMRFQFNHSIESDGIVGKDTLALLNVSVGERMDQIKVNMERWRWLPRDLGARYILVDIASFRLFVVEYGNTVMSMEAIVGKDYRNTPSFSGTMTYLVLGPYWNVPRTIAVEDKLPKILKDPKYLKRHGYEVFANGVPADEPLDPETIDWTELDEDYFPYRLRQKPGPDNALGRVKFMFPNEYAVYIHDTPERALFERSVRMFSSGCIRISKPLELAEYLLKEKDGWGRRDILRAIIKWNERVVRIDPVPIHIVYFTVWANEDGILVYRNDVYGRDTPLSEVLLPGGLKSIDQ